MSIESSFKFPPTNIRFRAAIEADQSTINAIIREASINPMGLKWEHFLLAVDDTTGEVVGAAQIKRHGDGSHELASVATRPDYQKRGIAGAIIQKLITQHRSATTAPLYLTCASPLRSFYERFGFRAIEPDQMPRYFKRLSRLTRWLALFTERKLLVMQWETPE
ncbi:MAG: GNAT family N-acetyltransferase [Anaerolineales bacterium]